MQFEVPFGCLHFGGAVLSDASAGESWEADEPSFVNGLEPCVNWWCSEGHVTAVDECRNGSDGDAVGSVKRLVACGGPSSPLAGVPPWKCAWDCCLDICHVQFGLFVKGSKNDGCAVNLDSVGFWFQNSGFCSTEEDCEITSMRFVH